MKKRFILVLGIITIMLITTIASANINVKKVTCENNISNDKNIKIQDVYLGDHHIIVDIINNEPTEETVYVSFYEREISEDGTTVITPIYEGDKTVNIQPGETGQVTWMLSQYAAYKFISDVYIGSESELLLKPRMTYDKHQTCFYWYKFFGWEFEQDKDFLEVNTYTNKVKYGTKQEVTVTITVTNHDNEDLHVVFERHLSADFRVFHRENGQARMVYQYSNSLDLQPLPLNLNLKAGETTTLLNFEWDKTEDNGARLGAGEYTIDGFMADYQIHGYTTLHPGNHDISPQLITLPKTKDVSFTSFNILNLLVKFPVLRTILL
jgi:hypothetical protein